jgi:hypothetical protein
MGTSRLFMPLLAELGGLGDGFCYKYVAPNGAPALARQLAVRDRRQFRHGPAGDKYSSQRSAICESS